MISLQEMSVRIGVAIGKEYAMVIRQYYAKYVLYLCIVLNLIANTVDIGSYIGAMASIGKLI